MALPDQDRADINEKLQWKESKSWYEFGSLNKSDIRDAINAVDDWIDDNSTSFNQAIPQPARSELTLKQKYRLFGFIFYRRWESE